MNLLTQKLKDGKMQVLEVPLPSLQKGQILVKNHYSLISAGTEGSTVRAARKGYIGKAKDRPQQVWQVIDTLKRQGIIQTYRAVMKKLDAYSPLGYSCAGEIIDLPSDVNGFRVGDFVASGGLTASHSEVVSVPVNLCVKLKSDADLRQAVYNTLGAIAMQGVRQADLRLGESCAIIGLGLLGQLTALLLKASGVQVVGIDIDPAMVEIARKHCLDFALDRDDVGIEDKVLKLTGGLGCDAVIICAASSSTDPINFAGAISRKRGTIVVVGDVPTGFDREPHFYKKELEVKMSCSYGPGRYDPNYEDKGIDYPPAYVRWTENRNMQAFQELIYTKKIDVTYLTTHTFKLDDAPAAYDMMMTKSEPFIGILIEYDTRKTLERKRVSLNPQSAIPARHLRSLQAMAGGRNPHSVNIGFIGAGSYAQSHLLPNIRKNKDVCLKGVMTASSVGSRSAGERFGSQFCTSNADDILENDAINTVFVATRHDSHAEYVTKALKARKHVFVEKPLCLNVKELEEIKLATDSPRYGHFLAQTAGRDAPGQASLPQLNKLRISRGGQGRQKHTQTGKKEFCLADSGQAKACVASGGHATNQPLDTSTNQLILMVGYNRRFSPLTQMIKKKFGVGPMSMIYRVNAGAIPSDSWIQDPEFGGGRIIGEVCHFVDFLTFINGSLPVCVYATAMESPSNLNDTLNVSLSFQNGSIGTISYFANGDRGMPKERVEIYADGCVAIIDNFKRLTIHAHGKKKVKKILSQDKGQKNEVRLFIDAILNGTGEVIPLEEMYSASSVTFKMIESIRSGECAKI